MYQFGDFLDWLRYHHLLQTWDLSIYISTNTNLHSSTLYVICFSIIILVQESLGGLLSFLNLYPFTSRISLSSLNSIRFLLVLRLIQDQPIIEMSTDLISCPTPLRSLLLILTILFSFFFRIHSIDHHLRQISRDVLPDCVSTCSSPMIDNNPNGCSNVCILPFALSSFLYHHQKKKKPSKHTYWPDESLVFDIHSLILFKTNK